METPDLGNRVDHVEDCQVPIIRETKIYIKDTITRMLLQSYKNEQLPYEDWLDKEAISTDSECKSLDVNGISANDHGG